MSRPAFQHLAAGLALLGFGSCGDLATLSALFGIVISFAVATTLLGL